MAVYHSSAARQAHLLNVFAPGGPLARQTQSMLGVGARALINTAQGLQAAARGRQATPHELSLMYDRHQVEMDYREYVSATQWIDQQARRSEMQVIRDRQTDFDTNGEFVSSVGGHNRNRNLARAK